MEGLSSSDCETGFSLPDYSYFSTGNLIAGLLKPIMMNEHCFTGLIGKIPYLFVPDGIMFATPVLKDIGGKVYEGDVFFYVSATDLWGRVAGHHLELVNGDEPVLSCAVTEEVKAQLLPESAFLLIGAPFQLTAEQMQAGVEAPQALEQIQEWMRKKEEEHGLGEEDINALIMGVYATKPFED